MIAYLILNAVNGKGYVGITSRTAEVRFAEHLNEARQGKRRALLSAIRRYGPENFSVVQISTADDWKSLCELERELILKIGTKAPNGYNLTGGGDGAYGLSRDIVESTAAKNRGRKQTDEARAKIGAASKGRMVSSETRAKIRAARIGKPLTLEHRAKLAQAKIGRKQTPRSATHSARIAEGLKRAWARRKGQE